MKTKAMLTSVLAGFLICVPLALATSIPIQNASFDSSSGLQRYLPWFGSWTEGDISGWSYTGDTEWGIWSPTHNVFSQGPPDGNTIGYLNGGSIYQELDGYLAANSALTAMIYIGNRSDLGFPDYAVELLSGGQVVASGGHLVPGEGLFELLTFSYAVGAGDPHIGGRLGVRIRSAGKQLDFDGLQLQVDPYAHVPEPSALLLLGFGLLGLAAGGRKRISA